MIDFLKSTKSYRHIVKTICCGPTISPGEMSYWRIWSLKFGHPEIMSKW